MNCNKATHRGTCQICGCTQLLPNARLSKHGYTVKWGFFSGICAGAHGLPFEQSTDLIEAAIARVEKQIADANAEIAELRDINSAVNDGTNVWKQIYADNAYHWAKVTLELRTKTYGDHSVTSCIYTTVQKFSKRGVYGPVSDRVSDYSDKRLTTIREWAHYINEQYAKHLERLNEDRRRYIKWQRERVANWAPAPLIAR